MSGHTPGPWTVEPHTNHDKSIVILEPRCAIDNDDVDHAEAEANARLIAAAPDMLTALRGALVILESMPRPTVGLVSNNVQAAYDRRHEAVRAAIAKAEGRS